MVKFSVMYGRENSAKTDYSKLHTCVTSYCSKARGFITWQDQAKWTSVILSILTFGTSLIVVSIFVEGVPRTWQNPNMSQVCSYNHVYCLSISLQVSLIISMLFEKQIWDLLKGIPSHIFPWTSPIFHIKQYSIVWDSRHWTWCYLRFLQAEVMFQNLTTRRKQISKYPQKNKCNSKWRVMLCTAIPFQPQWKATAKLCA